MINIKQEKQDSYILTSIIETIQNNLHDCKVYQGILDYEDKERSFESYEIKENIPELFKPFSNPSYLRERPYHILSYSNMIQRLKFANFIFDLTINGNDNYYYILLHFESDLIKILYKKNLSELLPILNNRGLYIEHIERRTTNDYTDFTMVGIRKDLIQ